MRLLDQPPENMTSGGVLEYRQRLVEIDHLLPNPGLGSGGLLKTQLEHRIISFESTKHIMGAAKTVFLTVLTIAGILLLALSFAASYADEYLNERISEDCEDEVGTIGEIIGADEGQCQDARDLREQVDSVGRLIGFVGASCLVFTALMIVFRRRGD